jgi:hypothetical protein
MHTGLMLVRSWGLTWAGQTQHLGLGSESVRGRLKGTARQGARRGAGGLFISPAWRGGVQRETGRRPSAALQLPRRRVLSPMPAG